MIKILNKINADDENTTDYLASSSPYDLSDFSCSYSSEKDLLKNSKLFANPSVLSFNIQSLSAKFN